MKELTLQKLAQWCGGQIDPKYKDVAFLGANNDTRKLTPGQLFVALKGVRDGHEFIPVALEKGAEIGSLRVESIGGGDIRIAGAGG